MKPLKSLTILIPLLAGAPALAQQSFDLPEGCTGTMTVQHKGCVVVNVWQCAGDPAGDQWLATSSQNGLFGVQRVDDEFQWLEAFRVIGNTRLITPADDPASLTELFEAQIDTWDFTLETDDGPERHVGFDMLTGETTVIDGVTLLNTEYQGRTLDAEGNETEASTGAQYVSPEHRLFFFGRSWDAATPDDVLDMSPLEFIFPGEPGFMSAQPKYECNQIETSFQP